MFVRFGAEGTRGIERALLSPAGGRRADGSPARSDRNGTRMAQQACTGFCGAGHDLHRRNLQRTRFQRLIRPAQPHPQRSG